MASRPHVDAQKWLRALIDEAPMAIGFSRDGVMLEANRAYVELFGYAAADELVGRSILDQIAPSHRKQIVEMVAQRARGEDVPVNYLTRGLRKDGTEFPFEVTTTRVVVEDGPLTIAFMTDVSEREATVDALRASEERFRTLSAGAFEGVFVHAAGKIVLANEAGATMFGFDDPAEMVGVAILDLTAPESRAMVLDRIRSGATEPYEGVGLRKDGSTFHGEVRGKTLVHQGASTRVTIIRDVSARHQAEVEQRAMAERMRQAQKLESLGMLAGGVAHDFNNLLTIITNGVELARRAAGPPAEGHLSMIALAAQRAADLCRQMLAYAGKAAFAREGVDLSALVAEMSSMLDVSVAKKGSLRRELASGLPLLLGDGTQIRQVVMNLVLNASEALGSAPGTVVVSTGQGTYGEHDLARSAAGGEPKPGRYVWVEVSDDGVGMDAATTARMFDPFFTTKFVGRGLGMAAVLGIVRAHAGAIEVDSAVGRGTRIRVLFPVAPAAAASVTAGAAGELRGEGLILVVDDEKNVRVSTSYLLQGFGFEVLVARDGVEAVEMFRANAARIDAVVLDLTMPRMGGVEALAEIRSIAPTAPVVLASGYGSMPLEAVAVDAGSPRSATAPDALLPKPYTARQLFEAIERARAARH